MLLMTSTNGPIPGSDAEARDPTFVGRLACLTQAMFAAIIGAMSSAVGSTSPDFLPRGFVLLGVLALPAAVGLMGVRGRRPALLLAAALAAGVSSLVAFSGVLLIFLIPAALFVVGAIRVASAGGGDHALAPRRWWPLGLVAQLGLAALLFALMIGAGGAVLLMTDDRCWTTTLTPAGVTYDIGPMATGEIVLSGGLGMQGCSSGLISGRGVAIGGLLGGLAMGVASLAARRRGGEDGWRGGGQVTPGGVG